MKSDSIWILEPGKMEIRAVDIPDPKYDEVQIQTKACGVCCWDSYLFRGISAPGPLPYIIGHEGAGIVHKVGAGVTKFKPGDKVFCAGGSNEQMSQYFNLKDNGLTRIPDDVTDFVPWVIEPTVTVVNVLTWTGIEPGDTVALVGAGYMGMLTLMGLTRGYPCGRIVVFEKQAVRREMARALGGCEVYDPYDAEGQAAIEALRAAGGADKVIEFSADESGLQIALQLVRKRAGRLTVGSWHRQELTFDGTQLHMGGILMNNVAPNTTVHYEDLIPRTAAMVKRGIFNPGRLVTHVANYKDCLHVFERAIDKKDGYIKGVITF